MFLYYWIAFLVFFAVIIGYIVICSVIATWVDRHTHNDGPYMLAIVIAILIPVSLLFAAMATEKHEKEAETEQVQSGNF